MLSAVTAAFIVETYKQLRPDPEDRSEKLLEALLVRIQDASSPAILPAAHFTPTTKDVVTNSMLFLSLSFSLFAGLGAILVKQWTRTAYKGLSVIAIPRERARAHIIRMQGIKDWKMAGIIEAVPMLLQVSLFFFFTGLNVWLATLHQAILGLILAVSIIALGLYLAAAFIRSKWKNAPFDWPTATLMRSIITWVTALIPTCAHEKPKYQEMATHVAIGPPVAVATPLGRVAEFGDDADTSRRDSVDFRILLDILNHPETITDIGGVLDSIRLTLLDGHIELVHNAVGDDLMPTVIEKARNELLSSVEIENHKRVLNSHKFDLCLLGLQFFEVALQRIDFSTPSYKETLTDVRQVATLVLDQAREAKNLEEIALSLSVILRTETALGIKYNKNLQKILALIHRIGPEPPVEREEDMIPKREWLPHEYQRFQDATSSLCMAILEAVKASWLTHGPPADETRVEDLMKALKGLILGGMFVEEWDRSYPVLKRLAIDFWMRSATCPHRLCEQFEAPFDALGINGICSGGEHSFTDAFQQ